MQPKSCERVLTKFSGYRYSGWEEEDAEEGDEPGNTRPAHCPIGMLSSSQVELPNCP